MRIGKITKPVVTDCINRQWGEYTIDLHFIDNFTVIAGDSATGKTFLAAIILGDIAYSSKILRFNYSIMGSLDTLVNTINTTRGAIFVLDNADLLLTEEVSEAILAHRHDNQYIFIGRRLNGFLVGLQSYSELVFDANTKTFSLVYPFMQ